MVRSAYMGRLGVLLTHHRYLPTHSRESSHKLFSMRIPASVSPSMSPKLGPAASGAQTPSFDPAGYPCFNSLKTYDILTAAGIPCTVVLDSAVAYVMDKVDFVLVGSEAVVESGGLINAVGSNQMAIIAKAQNKPFYALAERWFPHASLRSMTN